MGRSTQIQQIVEDTIRRWGENEHVSVHQLTATHTDLMPELGHRLARAKEIKRALEGPANHPDRSNLELSGSDRPEFDGSRMDSCVEYSDAPPGYEIWHEIDSGGQGIVYKAYQPALERVVAVKMLPYGPRASDRDRHYFEREAKLVARLDHPNIVKIYDSGIAQKRYYFAMEYVDGKPLDKHAQFADLTHREIMKLFAKVCDAITYAHQHSVIHRDLKPNNILVDEANGEARPRVLDFGLAKRTDPQGTHVPSESGVSLPGQIMGTFAYMSPEQASGQLSDVDVRTDVYALGVILYQLLTKRLPYDVTGSFPQIFRSIQEAEPVKPSKINRHLDSDIDGIVLMALAKDPDDRYQTSAQLLEDVKRWLEGLPLVGPRGRNSIYVIRKLMVKHWYVTAMIGLLSVIALGLGYATRTTVLRDDLNGDDLGCWEWSRLAPGTSPSPRYAQGMAYDSTRDVTVLFGGHTDTDPCSLNGETWEWDGTTWTLKADTGPSPRISPAMAYDSDRGVTVLFGGHAQTHSHDMLSGDTWEWNGTTWTQRATTGPSPRTLHAMVYDSSRGETVLFGGQTSGTEPRIGNDETWVWNGTTWTQRSVPGPSSRYCAAMAYDSTNEVTVLFGGGSHPSTFLDETWVWDGRSWTHRSDSGGPWPRCYHAMAYDSTRNVTVLFGGHNGITENGETCEWDGTDWTFRGSTGPSARYLAALAYDSGRGVTVLFGGHDGTNNDRETWEWDGTNWTNRSSTGPSARHHHRMAYDSGRGVTVLFGGHDVTADGETWEWDGTNWTHKSSSGPSPRYGHDMAYDSHRGRTVLFGGYDGTYHGKTWEWDGTDWTHRSSSGPSPRVLHRMAYDSARGVTVLFGGSDGNYNSETWEWNGTVWALRSSRGPSPCCAHAMVFDAKREVTVLLGGYDGSYNGETWEWDGMSWARRSSPGPSPRQQARMIHDSAHGVTVLCSGYDGNPPDNETWVWNGTKWSHIATTNLFERSGHNVVYDSNRQVAVLFGGTEPSYKTNGETWEGSFQQALRRASPRRRQQR